MKAMHFGNYSYFLQSAAAFGVSFNQHFTPQFRLQLDEFRRSQQIGDGRIAVTISRPNFFDSTS